MHPTPLRFLGPGWFAMVMGLAGLALAWSRAVPRMGAAALLAATALAGLAAVVFGLLLALSAWRAARHPEALADDLRHPVRQAFVATAPVSLLLLATLLLRLDGVSSLAQGLWMLGAASEFGVTLWLLTRWLRARREDGLSWAAITPVLIIPVVGNVVPPLAGVDLGFAAWSAAQFGVGLFFWPVVMSLLLVRIGVHGLWPERMLASTFITVAPPAVIGTAAAALGAPAVVAWMCWGIALFFLAWSASVLPRLRTQPFTMTAWSISFPLTAFTALTLRLADVPATPPAFGVLALFALAGTTLVIAALAGATVQGLRRGTLLAPEPVAAIAPMGEAHPA